MDLQGTPPSPLFLLCPLFLLLFQPLQYFVYIIGLRAPRLVVKKGAVPAFTPASAPPHSSDFILMNILDNIAYFSPCLTIHVEVSMGFARG